MNILEGEIISVQTNGTLSVVRINIGESEFTSIVIETPKSAPYLAIGKKIRVLFKETEVVIARGSVKDICIQNQLPGRILQIENGELLSKLLIETGAGSLGAILLTESIRMMDLALGDEITAMIKATETMLAE